MHTCQQKLCMYWHVTRNIPYRGGTRTVHDTWNGTPPLTESWSRSGHASSGTLPSSRPTPSSWPGGPRWGIALPSAQLGPWRPRQRSDCGRPGWWSPATPGETWIGFADLRMENTEKERERERESYALMLSSTIDNMLIHSRIGYGTGFNLS